MTADFYNLHTAIRDNIEHDYLDDMISSLNSWQSTQAFMLERLWDDGVLDKRTALEVLAHTEMPAGWWRDRLTDKINETGLYEKTA
jgi:hypothetical protein